jgi:hypothetical protein
MRPLIRDVAVVTAASIVAMVLVRDTGGCLLVAAWSVTALALVVAVRAVLAPSWWVTTVLGAALWFGALAVLCVAAARVSGRPAGENAMIFLGPALFLPLAMTVSAVVRLVLWARRRSAAHPPA